MKYFSTDNVSDQIERLKLLFSLVVMLTIVSVLYITVHIIILTTQHSIRLFKFHVIPSFVIAPRKETDKEMFF